MNKELISKATPVLLIFLAVLNTFIYWFDDSLISPLMTVFLSILLAAMGWINYRLNKEFDQVTKIAEDALDRCDEFSEMYEREAGKNMSAINTINSCIEDIEKTRAMIQKLL